MRYRLPEHVKLFEHQREAVRRLVNSGGVQALLWDPGVGKTPAVISYLGLLACASEDQVRVLVVCPKVVQDSWLSQTNFFLGPDVSLYAEVLQGSITEKAIRLGKLRKEPLAPSEGIRVVRGEGNPSVLMAVVNTQALSSRRQSGKGARNHADLVLAEMKRFAPHVLVVDESHMLKSPNGNASRLVARMAQHVSRRILLTGTVMPRSPMDVWSQWKILDSSVFSTNGKPWAFSQYQEFFGQMGGYLGKEVTGYRNLDVLEDKMALHSFPLRKEEALDLPPTTDVIVPVRLSAREARAYAEMKESLVTWLDSGEVMSSPSRLTQMLRLRQITSGFGKDDITGLTVELGTSRQDAAVELIENLMASENRVVVFAWARPEVDGLVHRLNKTGEMEAHAITGDTPDQERLRLRQQFGDTKKHPQKIVLVAQIAALNLGVNELVSASHALFLSLSQRRDELVQAKGRLDRQGQIKPVTFYYLTVPGSIDEVVLRSHNDRTDLEKDLLKHIRGEAVGQSA